MAVDHCVHTSEIKITTLRAQRTPPLVLRSCGLAQSPNAKLGLRVEMTLEQACPLEY